MLRPSRSSLEPACERALLDACGGRDRLDACPARDPPARSSRRRGRASARSDGPTSSGASRTAPPRYASTSDAAGGHSGDLHVAAERDHADRRSRCRDASSLRSAAGSRCRTRAAAFRRRSRAKKWPRLVDEDQEREARGSRWRCSRDCQRSLGESRAPGRRPRRGRRGRAPHAPSIAPSVSLHGLRDVRGRQAGSSRKASTATSLAALYDARAVPPRTPASLASASMGKVSGSGGWNSSAGPR